MTHQYVVTFVDHDLLSRGKQALASVACDGKEIFDFGNTQEIRLLFGQDGGGPDALHPQPPWALMPINLKIAFFRL